MKLLLTIVLLAVISIAGTRITFMNRRLPLGFRSILLTGTEYIFIGLALGGSGLDLLDGETRHQLWPFLIFGLAWIGFLFGLQFEFRQLKKIPHRFLRLSAFQSAMTFAVVSGSMVWYLGCVHPDLGSRIVLVSMMLGAIASCTAQSALAIVSRRLKISKAGALELLRFISSIDGIFAIGLFGLVVLIFPPEEGGWMIQATDPWVWLMHIGIFLVSGLVPALIVVLLTRVRFSQMELILFIVGGVMFAGGLAQELAQAPLIAGFLMGVVFANLSRHRLRVMSLVLKAEKSMYIILLIILGAGWSPRFNMLIIIAGFYFLMRVLGKWTGMFAGMKLWCIEPSLANRMGLGLISDGGFSVALLISFHLLYPGWTDRFVTVIILSVFMGEFLAPGLLMKLFGSGGGVLKRNPHSAGRR